MLTVHREFAGILHICFHLTLLFNQKGVTNNLRLQFSSLFNFGQKYNSGNSNQIERNNIFHLISLLEAKNKHCFITKQSLGFNEPSASFNTLSILTEMHLF